LLGARPYLGQVRIEKGLVTGFSTWGNCFFGCLSVGGFRSPGADSLGSGYDLFSYGLSFRLNDPSVPTDPSVFLYADIFATDVKAGSDVEKILFQDGSDDAGFQKGELYGNCKSRANGHYYECVSGQTKETLAVYTKFEQLTDAEYEARQMNVPEPGSLALMFSALGAAAWVRRRKASTR
jgi:hypothetical protein